MPQDLTCDLDRAVAHIFRVMLALECTPVQNCAPRAIRNACISATVCFSGGVAGWFAVAVDSRAARALAAHLTGMPEQELSTNLSSDTVAELCNVIAGNWKSRRPPPLASCTLSPPSPATHGPEGSNSTVTRVYSFASHQLMLQLSLC